MLDRFVITTGITASPNTVDRAKRLSETLATSYVPRSGSGLGKLLDAQAADYVLIVQEDRLALSDGETVYSYHPNMLLVRGLNVLRAWRDTFIDAAELKEGETVIDCTVGFACEASLAALAVGASGAVIGLESKPALAEVTRQGLRDFDLDTPPLRDAMRRVRIETADYGSYLAEAPEKSADLVAFDPFFDDRIEGSEHSVNPLVRFGDPRPLDIEAVIRARAIARRRVLVKHPRFTPLPHELIDIRSAVVFSRKGPTAYSIFDPV